MKMVKKWMLRWYYRLKGRATIGKSVILDRECFFEGANSLGDRAELGSCSLGYASYVARDSRLSFTRVGRFSCIGAEVITCLGIHPTKEFVSVHPAFYSTLGQSGAVFTRHNLFEEHKYVGDDGRWVVEIGSDCWIGNRVMIMDGIRIGHGAVVAGGAMVTRDVQPYEVVGGIPAKNIGWRFTEEERRRLLELKWWEWPPEKIQSEADRFIRINDFIETYATK